MDFAEVVVQEMQGNSVAMILYFLTERIIRMECLKMSVHSFGYGYIFDERARKFAKWLGWLNIMGILVPSVFGAAVITYYKYESAVESIFLFSGAFAIFQFGL